MTKLVAAIAVRNTGSRLYGKPIQNLDIMDSITILDNLVDCIKTISCIDEICLGISEGIENEIYIDIAKKKGLQYIIGDEHDVLQRRIDCGRHTSATDVFRVTSEDPFLYFEEIESAWREHVSNDADYTTHDNIIDGVGFSITKLSAFELSHLKGDAKHRSELCNLYIRENMNDFKTIILPTPKELIRKDLRLTVDYPEDLIVCRKIFSHFRDKTPKIPIKEIVKFLDMNPELKKLIEPFTEIGYSTMY